MTHNEIPLNPLVYALPEGYRLCHTDRHTTIAERNWYDCLEKIVPNNPSPLTVAIPVVDVLHYITHQEDIPLYLADLTSHILYNDMPGRKLKHCHIRLTVTQVEVNKVYQEVLQAILEVYNDA